MAKGCPALAASAAMSGGGAEQAQSRGKKRTLGEEAESFLLGDGEGAPRAAGKVVVYGMGISGNVIPTVLFCLDYNCGGMEMMNILKGEHKTPEKLALNPFGQMPIMVDGDVQIAESSAILRYLAKVYAPEAYGLTVREQAVTDWAMDWVATTFTPDYYKGIWYPVAGFGPKPEDQEAVNKAAAEKLDIFAKRFLTNRFIGGDELCIADYKFGPLAWYMSHPAIRKHANWKNPRRIRRYVEDFKCALSVGSRKFLEEGWGFMDTKL